MTAAYWHNTIGREVSVKVGIDKVCAAMLKTNLNYVWTIREGV